MYNIKLENYKCMGTLPTIQCNIYDTEADTIHIRGIIMPFNSIAFKAFKLQIDDDGSYDITGTTYGTSPHVPFDMYFMSGNNDSIDKKLILGQFMLCVLDFIDIQNNLDGIDGKLIAPNFGRSMNNNKEVTQFITATLDMTRR